MTKKKKSSKKTRMAILIDGNNFRHGLKSLVKDELIHWKTFLESISKDYELVSAKYYIGKITSPLFDEEKVHQQEKIIRSLNKGGFEVWMGYFTEQKQEKAVDVQIALDLVRLSLEKKVDSIMLISGDGDLANAVEIAQSHGTKVILGYIAGIKNDHYRISWRLKDKTSAQAALNSQVQKAHEKWLSIQKRQQKSTSPKKVKKKIKHLLIFSDGGARGNPGPAGCGAVLTDEKGTVIKKISEFIGKTTNNQAEYMALLYGLAAAETLKPEKITCYLDSKLVVEQASGRWKVKNKELQEYHQQIQAFVKKFPNTSFHHIPRAKNKLADKLANEAMDRAQ